MTEFKDLTDKVNRLYLDLREAERQRDENLAKVLSLQATVRELDARLDMISRPYKWCQICGGSGNVDSGGMTPWMAPIFLPCPACTPKEPCTS